MKRIFIVATAAILVGCATSSGVLRSGTDTFTVNTSASPGRGGAAAAKKSAYDEANQECAKQNKAIDVAMEKNSASAKRDFQLMAPCPSTGQHRGKCPGYVIDHFDPLCHGGADAPINMQWQTVVDAKKKDVDEVGICRASAKHTAKPRVHRYASRSSSKRFHAARSTHRTCHTGPRGRYKIINACKRYGC